MTEQRRTAADIGLPCYIDTPTGIMRWPDPASREARHVWIAGHDALALRDKLTAAEAALADAHRKIADQGMGLQLLQNDLAGAHRKIAHQVALLAEAEALCMEYCEGEMSQGLLADWQENQELAEGRTDD
jgi:hypothetical protein